MVNSDLAELFKQQDQIRRELSKVNAAIGHLCKTLDNVTVEHTKSSVTPDDAEFAIWLNERRKKQHRTAASDKIKRNNILQPGYTAVYALYDNDEIVYIGVTNNMQRRVSQHKVDKKFTSYQILEAHTDRYYAVRQEHMLIEEHNPKYNKQSYI